MALRLTSAITDGIRRVLTRTGGVLFGLLLLQQFLLITSLNTVLEAQAPRAAADVIGLSLPVPATVAGAVFLGSVVFSGVYFVVLARAFARPQSRLSSFPADLYTRRMGRATLSMLVGGLVVSIAITVGFVLFILPGLFLSACFLFFIFAIGVEDRGVTGALKRSWALSKGHRLRLVVIVLATGLAGLVVGVVPTLFQLAGAPALGDVATVLLNGTIFVFVYGVMAAAYLQVRQGDGSMGGPGTAATAPASGDLEL
jgi:hypothetical protein